MSSIPIGVMRVRTTLERVVAIEDVGKAIVRVATERSAGLSLNRLR